MTWMKHPSATVEAIDWDLVADEIAAHLAFQGLIESDGETLRVAAATAHKVIVKEVAPC